MRARVLGAFVCLWSAGQVHAQTTAGIATTVVFPVAAQTASFASEMTLFNPGPNLLTASVRFYEGNNSGAPGPKVCNDVLVPGGRSTQFTLATQCALTGSVGHFGLVVVADKAAPQVNAFYGYARVQNPQGIGFSVEGFPVTNFNNQVGNATGLKRKASAPTYQTNCFVGSLDQPVSYQLKLFNDSTGAQLGGTLAGSLTAFQQFRYLDVFGVNGVNAPAGDLSNVRAEFTQTSGGSANLIGFCTVQDNTSFSADFRIAKSYGSPSDSFFAQGGNTFGATAHLGTNDNHPLELYANGQRVMRYAPDATSPNVIGGHSANTVGAFSGQTIAGGGASGSTCFDAVVQANIRPCANQSTGAFATISGGESNVAFDSATVAGGVSNSASGSFATVGGGSYNNASSDFTTVAGGSSNTAVNFYATVAGGGHNAAGNQKATVAGGYSNYAPGVSATIGGGEHNDASASFATVAGGSNNLVAANGATISGGADNQATNSYALVAGGSTNVASGSWATVAGGSDNTASGSYSFVAGGYANVASSYSFAGGAMASARELGMFVWADSRGFTFDPVGFRAAGQSVNTFNVRATGIGGVLFVTGINAATGVPTSVCYTQNLTGWSCTSDRNVKRNLRAVDSESVLAKVVAMQVYHWQPKDGPNREIEHLGPMAQDFKAAFGLGDSDKAIGFQDADGVALAAIQGLHQLMQQKDAKIDAQQREIAALKERMAGVEAIHDEVAQLRAAMTALTQHATSLAVTSE